MKDKEVSPAGGDLVGTHTKHEIISCDRCGKRIECKANSYTKCQCSVVKLNLNEVQYIAENYEGCMCAACLVELQEEYKAGCVLLEFRDFLA